MTDKRPPGPPEPPRLPRGCNCDPGHHPADGTWVECQRDLAHVYGVDNPTVAWLKAHHPDTLRERAMSYDDDEDDEWWPW